MTEKINNEGTDFAAAAAKIALELKCSDVTVMDLRGLSPATDFFMIATGTSDRQRRTVIDEITQLAKTSGFQRFGQAGYEQGRWILVDFVTVVVHVFDEEYRKYYDLEMLWGDAKQLAID